MISCTHIRTYLNSNGVTTGLFVVECCVGRNLSRKFINLKGHDISTSDFNNVIKDGVVDSHVEICSCHSLHQCSLLRQRQRKNSCTQRVTLYDSHISLDNLFTLVVFCFGRCYISSINNCPVICVLPFINGPVCTTCTSVLTKHPQVYLCCSTQIYYTAKQLTR